MGMNQRTRVLCEHAHFKIGRTLLEDDERSGWASTNTNSENVNKIETKFNYNARNRLWNKLRIKDLNFGVPTLKWFITALHSLTEP